MKNIKLKKISLENFKCHKALTIDFSGNTAIYGNNATGKTSIYDALTWLLFGKDSRGNGEKNIEIKPLDVLGNVKDHEAITSVEAVFAVDGTDTSLRRTYQEVWSTKRGALEPTYDGNTSEYFCDGVPQKKYAFQQKVNEMVSEDVFRILTSVSYFADELPWQERRAVLCEAAGAMDDKAIMATRDDFIPLLSAVGHLPLDDYKKKLTVSKRGLSGVRDEVPARINECEKTLSDLVGIDFNAARAEVDRLNTEKEALSAQLLAIENDTAVSQKDIELKQARLKLDELEAENKRYRAEQTSGQINTGSLKIQLHTLNNRLIQTEAQKKSTEKVLASAERGIENSRTEWSAENSKAFDLGKKCPTCGQPLPAEQMKAAMDAFEASKKEKCSEIVKIADSYKKAAANAKEQIALLESSFKELETEISRLETQIRDAETASEAVIIADMDGYADTKESILSYISGLEKELLALREDRYAASTGIREKIADVSRQISAAMEIAGKESILRYTEKRIEELRNEAQTAVQQLSEIEKMLYLIDEFTRYKTSFIEESINGLFRIARFRLFREQANGGVEDRCDVMHDGVPYISVNNGMKINLGIDIINTLSKVYGVSVPLFIDNAESVTAIERSDGQIIRLIVSEKDKELRVENED